MSAKHDHTVLLLDYLDGLLDAATRKQVAHRLTQDVVFQQHLEDLQRQRKTIVSALDATDVTVRLQPQVWQNVAQRTLLRRATFQRRLAASPLFAACVSITVIGLVVLFALGVRHISSDGQRETEVLPQASVTKTTTDTPPTLTALDEQLQLTATVRAAAGFPTVTGVSTTETAQAGSAQQSLTATAATFQQQLMATLVRPTIPPLTATANAVLGQTSTIGTAVAFDLQQTMFAHEQTATIVQLTIPLLTATARALIAQTSNTATARAEQQQRTAQLQEQTATVVQPTIPPLTVTAQAASAQLSASATSWADQQQRIVWAQLLTATAIQAASAPAIPTAAAGTVHQTAVVTPPVQR